MIKYNVDAEARTVTATLEGCHDDVVKTFNRRLGDTVFNKEDTFYKAFQIPDTFVGVAKCHPDDTFDEEKGKQLAKKRLFDNYHKTKLAAGLLIIELFDIFAEHIDAMINHEISVLDRYK